jgi:hypothetical protein
MEKINDVELLMLFQGACSLARLHSESGGLEQHKIFAEQQREKYREEILKRMSKTNIDGPVNQE